MRNYFKNLAESLVLLYVLLLFGCNPVPGELEDHTEKYMQSSSAKTAIKHLENRSIWKQLQDKYYSPGDDYPDGYIKGKIVPVDIAEKEIDSEVYAALPEYLRAADDTEAGTIILIRWNEKPTERVYTKYGTGEKASKKVGRSAIAVVIDRAKDSIVSALGVPVIAPYQLEGSAEIEGKYVPGLIHIIERLAARAAVQFPHYVFVNGTLDDSLYKAYKSNRIKIKITKWGGDEELTMLHNIELNAPECNEVDEKNSRFTIKLDREFAEDVWKGGFGEYVVVTVDRDSATFLYQPSPSAILARFKIDPGRDSINLELNRKAPR